ncbi:MAG: hypothetical protein M3O30_07855 [Planctomycetota bacterium]|nr:hypothetical protein [Planctomycetota bacterium]
MDSNPGDINVSQPPAEKLPDGSPLIPQNVVASPVEGDWLHEPGIPFWQPTWGDSLKYVGWRWLLFLPAILIFVFLFFIPSNLSWLPWLSIGGFKLLMLAVALPFSSILYAIKTAMQSRREPFCIHCGYTLTSLPDHYRCPECGRPYSFRLIDEYRRDPPWFIQRCRAHRELPASHQPFAAGAVRSKRRTRDGT